MTLPLKRCFSFRKDCVQPRRLRMIMEYTKTPDLSPGFCKLETASLLEMKSQTALEDMEFQVAASARQRIKRTVASPFGCLNRREEMG